MQVGIRGSNYEITKLHNYQIRSGCMRRTIMNPRPLNQRALAPTCIAAMLLPAAIAQDAAQSRQPGAFRFRVDTEVVLVNAVARDKQGKAITDLKSEDFTLFEDGKPQHILSFDYENLDTTPLGPPPAAGQPAEKPAAPPAPILTAKDADQALSNKRVMVLFFDLTGMNPDEVQRSVDAARKYLNTKMTAADMIAIASLSSSLRLDQDFTGDRARLLRVLNPFSHAEGQGMDNGLTGDADG